ncbi:hypothetical protein ACLK2D_15410 [Escherichia coli]
MRWPRFRCHIPSRKDKHTEAAFQFANVADSYAANSAQGDVRNTGVIGFAAFELQGPAKRAAAVLWTSLSGR